jgi:hypothetical protein
VSARGRIAAGYFPDWDIDSADGHQAVLFVTDVLDAMETGSYEVKRDREAVRTGNVYLEYRCKVSGQWVPSGIARTNADLFSIAIAPQVVVTSSVAAVQAVARKFWGDKRYMRECKVGGNPTKGMAIPVTQFVIELMHATP